MSKEKLHASNDVDWRRRAPVAAHVGNLSIEVPHPADFEELDDDTLVRLRTSRTLRGAMGEARASLRDAAEVAGQAARAAELAAMKVDGGKRGPLSLALFPRGTSLLLRRQGAERLPSMRRFVRRLWPWDRPGIEGYAAYRAHWLPLLDDALWELELAALDHDRAEESWEAASGADPSLRDAQAHAIEKLFRLVRAG